MRQAELIRYLVLAAQREGNRRLTPELRAIRLTPSQSEVLRILGDHAPLSLTGLGELLVCESGTQPSRLVDRLVAAGLVERVTAHDDQRHVTLTLTGAGNSIEAGVRDVEERLYADIDAATAGQDMRPVIEALRLLSAGLLAGNAVQNRISTPHASAAVIPAGTLRTPTQDCGASPATRSVSRFVLSRRARVFHLPGCHMARKAQPWAWVEPLTNPQIRRWIEPLGIRPCVRCHPLEDK
jgi:MarR family transcriptional regulator, organic hydroperoxide resistance regulator